MGASIIGLVRKLGSAVMKFLLVIIAVSLVATAKLSAQQTDFQLSVSGALAGKLPPDTQLKFWFPSNDTANWTEFAISDLPISLPFDQFKGHGWNVTFASERSRSSFSVRLSKDLFDKPRLINIPLDRPHPLLRPVVTYQGPGAKYSAAITKRMHYDDLPQWDNERQSLTKSRPPKITIASIRNGTVVYDGPMVEGCMASRWFAYIEQPARLNDGETYRMTAIYDSGGLFPPITTTHDFTYHAELHE